MSIDVIIQRPTVDVALGVIPVGSAGAPTAHADSHASDGSDPITPASIGAAAASHTHAPAAPAAHASSHAADGSDPITPSTLGLGELATMDVADLPGGSGIAAGAAWSPVAAGALTVDAWSATADPTLAVAGDAVSCSGIGGFFVASGAIPALLDLRLDDLSGVAVGYGVGAAVGIPDGTSSVWACVGILRVSSSVWRLMLVSRTTPHYIFAFWQEIGSVSSPYPDFASPPLRVRWDHGAGCVRVQLADSSWISYGPIDEMPPLAPREAQGLPTAWGVGLLVATYEPTAASSATVRLFSGADDGDIAWIGGDAGDELSRQPVPAVMSVLARASGGASRSLPAGPVGAEVLGAATQAAGRASLGLAAIASSGSASDLGSGTVAPERLGSGTPSATRTLQGNAVWGPRPRSIALLRAVSTRWYPVPNTGPAVAYSTAAMSAGIIRTHLWMSPDDHVIDAVGVNVTTLAAGAEIRIGVYADDGTGYPGALIADCGTVSGATTGVKTITGLSIPLSGGVPYHICVWGNAAPTLRALSLSGHIAWLGVDAALGTAPGIGWGATLAYTAGVSVLPSTFPVGAAVTTAITGTPFVRLSS